MQQPNVDTNAIAKGLGVTGFSPLADFLRLHVAAVMDDRAGNDPNLRNAANINKIDLGPERHGYDAGVDDIVYNKVNPNQDYYQSKIYDDLEQEKARRSQQDAHTDDNNPPPNTDEAIRLKNEADEEKMKAHSAVVNMMNQQRYRNESDA